jgi:hypothetical protein
MKECFKCHAKKPLSEFYRHPRMADGHVNKCKECNKIDVRENRKNKIDYYRECDRKRGNRLTQEWIDKRRVKFPKKYRANRMIAYHKAKGNIHEQPCEVCGSEKHIHAHHDDYDKPLNVRWLCAAHHHQWHAENGEGANAT